MTNDPPDHGFNEEELFGEEHLEEMQVEEPRRAASVVFRAEDETQASRADSLEAANQSLADALRIVYRLLQVVMVALALLFCFSGFQQVGEGESGIKVTLGRITASELKPGPQFSLPYPLGEIIKVGQGQVTMTVHREFWPALTEAQLQASLDELRLNKHTLAPDLDGSLITGDGSIVHVQWTLTYHRDDPAEYMANLNAEFEQRLVLCALQQATVRVAAESTVDEILKPKAEASDGSTVTTGRFEERVRRQAQDFIAMHEVGITIDSLSLQNATPPLNVRGEFNDVGTQRANRTRNREQAAQEANVALTAVAGTASGPILALLDRFEREIDEGRDDDAADTLQLVFGIFNGDYDGQPFTVDDTTWDSITFSGQASQTIGNARSYRRTIVSAAKAEAETFRARLAEYRANPRVFIIREFSEAYIALVNSGVVQQWVLPDGTEGVKIWLGADPEIFRRLERERNEAENVRVTTEFLLRNQGRAPKSQMDVLLETENEKR